MISISSRWRFAAAVSPLAMAIATTPAFGADTGAGTAQAAITGTASAAAATQTTPPPPSDTSANAENSDQPKSNAIVVTGFRAALRSSTAKKKNSETVVESVTAEDIGKLPDNGIGESIARLPGIAAQRNNGRANIISIRGFGPDFSTTTLNGRQQTTTNDSRAVEFDQYPSEILAGVDVYKTAEADHTAGGLVGSIDMRTIRPLDYGHSVLAVGVRGTYVDQKLLPGSKDWGGRIFGTYVDQFADDRVGVAISAAYTNEPYQTRDWNSWGYQTFPDGNQGMYGVKTWYESDQLKRLGTTATIQGKLSDNLTMTVDGFYSHFIDDIDQKGFEMPFMFSPFTSQATNSVSNGIVTSGTVTGLPVVENYATDHSANQYAIGWNTLWDSHTGWRAMGDLSWSRTDRSEHHIETTAGVMNGHSQAQQQPGMPPPPCVLANGCATLTYTDTSKGPVYVSNYNAGNPNLVLTDVEGWSGSPVQAGYDKLRTSEDNLWEARGEIQRDIDSGFLKSVKVGFDYTDRDKTLHQKEGFLSPPDGALSAPIPADLLQPEFTLDRGFGPILSWDPRALEAQGILVYTDNTQPNSGYHVTEKVWTPYVMAPIDSELGAVHLTGNVGFQAVHTTLTSLGSIYPTQTDKYWMWLPSLNLNFRWDSGFVIRFAASKEYMRPRLTDLANNVDFHYDNTTNPSKPPFWNGSGGNPFLRPYQAKALDLNFEKYFGNQGYIALQTFYKHIDTYIASGINTNFDYTPFPKPSIGANPPPPTNIGWFSTSLNTHGGYMYGAELAATLPFDIFSRSLSGFGLTGGAGYTKTHIIDFNGNPDQIPGYSKWVASLTAFYEKGGFSVRGSMRYRSGFIGDFVLFSGGLDRQYVLPETIFDAQIGYDFPETSMFHGISTFISVENLTNERSATLSFANDPNTWLKYQEYGRRYMAGVTYKFGAGAPPPPPPTSPLPPPPPPAPATQTCPDGAVILATASCPAPPPPPPPPAVPERGY